MAQQTINVGAAPNDGTGTPLRTAFQYTNSNFTELYTAVGPSGNNIVVPGTATITGDLTVDTSTLKVDSANNRVIIGHTSGSSAFQVTNAGAAGLEIQPTGFSSAPLILSYNRSGSAYTQLTLDGSTIVHALNGSTAMTLNSTGLGVGGSPFSKLSIIDTTNNFPGCFRGSGGGNTNFVAIGTTTLGASINGFTAGFAATADLILQPNGGNVGVGVTPSAWASIYKTVEFSNGASIWGQTDTPQLSLQTNAFLNSSFQWIYKTTAAAANYRQLQGSHLWYTAPSGTAGNAITFTQAMTLDASGNLLVGKTSASVTTVGFQSLSNGETSSTMAASTSAATTLNVYSTGATAYRFYVGMNGTISATNTTISAISDQRLKENVQDIDVGLGAILALKPRKFDWKAGKGKDIKGDRGFIAQEFEQVFPNLVDEWKDNAPEGEAPYKSVRQDLIPVLVKAIQELAAEVNALKNA